MNIHTTYTHIAKCLYTLSCTQANVCHHAHLHTLKHTCTHVTFTFEVALVWLGLMCCCIRVLQFVNPEQPGYVGFANLPNQVHRKSVKKGFEFTLMVVGQYLLFLICMNSLPVSVRLVTF